MLFGSLIFLAISFRYPFTPHEIGWDSFVIHKFINLLNHQGNYSSWWVHPLSPFGLTPFSYASAVPVLLSAFSQVSGLSIESSIWLFGVFCGILGIFGSYMVAKEVFNNDLYIFLVVFGFSTSSIFLAFTTWTLSTRGFFITFLPIFLFFLFRNAKSKKFNIYTVLLILSFISLVAIHHLYTLLLFPIILYTIIKRIYPFKKVKKEINLIKIINIICGIFLIIIILLVFLDILTTIPITGHEGARFETQIDWFIEIIYEDYAHALGILGLFGIIGFFCLLYKRDKSLNEVILVFIALVLAPFIFVSTYMQSFITIFIYLLAGFGLLTIYKIVMIKKNRAVAIMIIILILSISFAFSAYYQLYYPNYVHERAYSNEYMEEETYDAGLWLKYLSYDSVIFTNNKPSLGRISGVMNLKRFPGSNIEQLENGYVSVEDFEVEVSSIYDPRFWSETFYKLKSDGASLKWIAYILPKEKFNSTFSLGIIYKYNITYVLEHNQLLLDEEDDNKIFFISLNNNRYKMYSNREHSVWYLNY